MTGAGIVVHRDMTARIRTAAATLAGLVLALALALALMTAGSAAALAPRGPPSDGCPRGAAMALPAVPPGEPRATAAQR